MNRKNIISAIIFILLAVLTFYVIFKGNDMEAVVESVRTLHPLYLCAAVATAFFFVSAEGLRPRPPADSPCSSIICRRKGIRFQTVLSC